MVNVWFAAENLDCVPALQADLWRRVHNPQTDVTEAMYWRLLDAGDG